MKNLCVFCGSSSGEGGKYLHMAREVGAKMAKAEIGLVYGGASIGVMGELADSVLDGSGKVTGVIPQAIKKREIAHTGLTELITCDDMHTRKALMYEKSDGFLVLPGGLGTLDEMCEILTWAQLDYHQKPVWLLNANGFYDGFITHLGHCVVEGFLSKEHFKMLQVETDISKILQSFLKLN